MNADAILIAQIVVLIAAGRLLGELMHRIGQPAIMGQLIAGMLLGPSVFGALLPDWQHALFPSGAVQKAMLHGVSQLGILLILLVTGMETDLGLVRHSRRAALSVSVAGIALPFACGVWLGEHLPADLIPDPERRLVTSLFLGTALSISSVKIVGLLIRELGFQRRNVGQVIVASAIIDDSICWIIMSIVFGIALHGGVDPASLSRSVIGTLTFLAISLTLGRRVVFKLIRWTNDRFESELPVIAVILVITGVMALITDLIGVHMVLGAFVAGVLIGQSPILTRHIEEQLRGLIVALFMPVFFGTAGLSADLRELANPEMLLLTAGLIAVASVGKFSGALIGGRIGGLSFGESLAVGCGMNARGSTEIIIATFGMSMGVLSQDLFTAIVTMAVITTLLMPPMLRWSFRRLPVSAEEGARLEREAIESRSKIAGFERLLLAVDASRSGRLASHLVGLLAGARGMPTTALQVEDEHNADAKSQARVTGQVLADAAASGDIAAAARSKNAARPKASPSRNVDVVLRVSASAQDHKHIASEAAKGFGVLFIGREPLMQGSQIHEQIARSAASFAGAFAVVAARGAHRDGPVDARLNILVPVNGTGASRLGAELAVALAQGAQGTITALYITSAAAHRRRRRISFWRPAVTHDAVGEAVIRETIELGGHYHVPVRGRILPHQPASEAILRELRSGGFNLLVSGVSPRAGSTLSLGEVAGDLLERAQSSLLLISSEAATPQRRDAQSP